MKKGTDKVKKRVNMIIVFVVLALMVCIFTVRVRYVNGKYPKVTEQEYSVGEDFVWQDFEVNVASYQILNAEQVEQQWNISDTEYIDNYDLIIAELKVTYVGNDDSKKFPIVKVNAQSGAWYNSSELGSLRTLNNNNTLCKKNEMRTIYTAIGMSHEQLTSSERQEIKEKGIQLMFQKYSEIVYVDLKQ